MSLGQYNSPGEYCGLSTASSVFLIIITVFYQSVRTPARIKGLRWAFHIIYTNMLVSNKPREPNASPKILHLRYQCEWSNMVAFGNIRFVARVGHVYFMLFVSFSPHWVANVNVVSGGINVT